MARLRAVPNRLDSRGRKIGRNWWREFNCDMLLTATLMWESDREAQCNGWATEEREFLETNPRPTLKQFLETNQGMERWRAA